LKLSIAKKLYLLLVPTVTVGIVVCTITWKALSIGLTDVEKANEMVDSALKSRIYVTGMSDAMKGFMLDPKNKSEAERKKQNDELYGKAMDALHEASQDKELTAMIDQLHEFDKKALDPKEDEILELVKTEKYEDARAMYLNEYLPLFNASNKHSMEISDKVQGLAQAEINEVKGNTAWAMNVIILSLAAGVFILAGLITYLAVSLSRSLRTVASGLEKSGNNVATASEILSEAGQNVSSGTSEAASSLEETVASVEELTSMVKLNSENATEAAKLSHESSQSAITGEQEMKSLMDSMSEIASSSKKIEEIINVIDDIAFQTNLLALNAAVEAARAGEQGRGFAVVAEAVRNLAQRSATAAKDITTLIHEATTKTEMGVKTADRSSIVLKQMVESIQKVASLNNEIASASTEQSNGIAQISKAMNELDKSTQSNSAAASSVAAESEGVAEQAMQLRDLVFELKTIVEGDVEVSTKKESSNKHTNGAKVLSFSERKLPLTGNEQRAEKHPKAKLGSVDKF
jgi:methyl-accepting chemotaxis protein